MFNLEAYGLQAVPVVYYLIQILKNAGLLRQRWAPVAAAFGFWIPLQLLNVIWPLGGQILFYILAAVAATVMFHGAVKGAQATGSAAK